MKVAVIGSGIGGLSATWLLAREHEVHLFEKTPRLGMDAHAIEINDVRIDTPPRAFSASYYPHLTQLYACAGVRATAFSWAFTYYMLGETTPYMSISSKANAFRRVVDFGMPTWTSLTGLWRLLKPTNLRDLLHALSFHYYMSRHWAGGNNAERYGKVTLREYYFQNGFSEGFLYRYLLPMLSMVCTCSYKEVLDYPMSVIMEYMTVNSTSNQCRTDDSTEVVAEALAAGAHRVVLSANITGVFPEGGDLDNKKPYLEFAPPPAADKCDDAGMTRRTTRRSTRKSAAASGRWREEFDVVIVATDAANGAKLLGDADRERAALLRRFEHAKSRVVVHTNESIMPANRADWRAANLGMAKDERACMFTLFMTHPNNVRHLRPKHRDYVAPPESSAAKPLFMSWNPVDGYLARGGGGACGDTTNGDTGDNSAACATSGGDIRDVLCEREFYRPIVTPASRDVVDDLWRMQGRGGVYFVGAYSLFRVPLQESAVTSAVQVAELLGTGLPKAWRDAVEKYTAEAEKIKVSWSDHAAGSAQGGGSAALSLGGLRVIRVLTSILVACVSAACAAALDGSDDVRRTGLMLLYFAAFGGSLCTILTSFPWARALMVTPSAILAVPVALAALWITWSLILSFMFGFDAREYWPLAPEPAVLTAEELDTNAFVQAYVMVSGASAGWAWSSQLLVWVVPGCLFLSIEGDRATFSPGLQMAYCLTAFLGAVSLAFPVAFAHLIVENEWRCSEMIFATSAAKAKGTVMTSSSSASSIPERKEHSPAGSPRVSALWLVCGALALVSAQVMPWTVDAKDATGRTAYVVALFLLHVVLLVPFAAKYVTSTARGDSDTARGDSDGLVSAATLFAVLAVLAFAIHVANLAQAVFGMCSDGTAPGVAAMSSLPCFADLTRRFVVAGHANVCQSSITFDVYFTILATSATVTALGSRGAHEPSRFAASAAFPSSTPPPSLLLHFKGLVMFFSAVVACLLLSPGAVMAAYASWRCGLTQGTSSSTSSCGEIQVEGAEDSMLSTSPETVDGSGSRRRNSSKTPWIGQASGVIL